MKTEELKGARRLIQAAKREIKLKICTTAVW